MSGVTAVTRKNKIIRLCSLLAGLIFLLVMCADYDVVLRQSSFNVPREYGVHTHYRKLWRVAYDSVFPANRDRWGRFEFRHEDIKQAIPEWIIPKTVYGNDIKNTLISVAAKSKFPGSKRRIADKRTLDGSDIDSDTPIEVLEQITEYDSDTGFFRIYDRDIETNRRFRHYSLWEEVDIEKRLFRGSIAYCSWNAIREKSFKELNLNLPDYFTRGCTYAVDSKRFDFGYRIDIMEINVKHSERLIDYLDNKLASWQRH